jgi:PPP family 3-phenylpropionic acid transporter
LPSTATPLFRFILLYCVLYGAFGAASPFLPFFLTTRGVTAEELGIVFATSTAVRLLAAPFAARLADRFNALRLLLVVFSVAAAAATLCYLPAQGFQALLFVSLCQAVALAPTSNLADALALLASNDKSGTGFEYGWVRGAGSAAFIAASIVAGIGISVVASVAIFWLQAALLMAVPWATRGLPATPALASDPDKHGSRPRILLLLKSPAFCRVVLVAALILGSHAMHDTFAVIRWRAAGITPWQTSLLWSVAVAAEVVVFFLLGPQLVHNLTAPGAMALAAVCGAVRWAITAVTANVVAIALSQPLHGFTFALLHLACMHVIAQTVPRQLAATAQAIYGTVGIGMATASLILLSGWLYGLFGPPAFFAMSLLCLCALPLAFGLRRTTTVDIAEPPARGNQGASPAFSSGGTDIEAKAGRHG